MQNSAFAFEHGNSLLIPNPSLLELLRGTTKFHKEVVSQKPLTKGQRVTVLVADSGACLAGLSDYKDSREWYGLNNNLWKTARIATHIAILLKHAGVSIDPQLCLNAMLVFKLGRRRWDESNWYGITKVKGDDTDVSLDLLEKAGFTDIAEIVSSRKLGLLHPISAAWEGKVCMYADFRVNQNVCSLNKRFEDLYQRRRAGIEALSFLSKWAFGVEEEIFSKLAILPEDIDNDNPQMPYWEVCLRNAYLEDCQVSSFGKINALQNACLDGEFTLEDCQLRLKDEFPHKWGEENLVEHRTKKGIPLQTSRTCFGIEEAIEVFKKLKN